MALMNWTNPVEINSEINNSHRFNNSRADSKKVNQTIIIKLNNANFSKILDFVKMEKIVNSLMENKNSSLLNKAVETLSQTITTRDKTSLIKKTGKTTTQTHSKISKINNKWITLIREIIKWEWITKWEWTTKWWWITKWWINSNSTTNSNH